MLGTGGKKGREGLIHCLGVHKELAKNLIDSTIDA